MKPLSIIILISVSSICSSIPFDKYRRFPHGFGVNSCVSHHSDVEDTSEVKRSRVKNVKRTEAAEKEASVTDVDDYERAEDAVFHAVENAEKAVLHAVEDEVDLLFHDLPKHKNKVATDAGKKIAEVAETENAMDKKEHKRLEHLKEMLEESISASIE